MSQLLVHLFVSFFMIGLGAYGGGTVTIPLILHEAVHKNNWLTELQFTELVALAQMTPGPIAINAATLVGYRTAGFWGSLVATIGVVTPSVMILALVIGLLGMMRNSIFVKRLRRSVKPGVLLLITMAGISIGRLTLISFPGVVVGLATFLALSVARDKIHPVLWVVFAGIAGIMVF